MSSSADSKPLADSISDDLIAKLEEMAVSTGQPQATLEPLDLTKLNWKLEPSFATEAQTFYMMMKDGTTAFIQLVYSSMGLSASTQMTSRVFHADKEMDKIKTISGYGTDFQASEDGFSCTTKEMSIDWNPDSKSYKVHAEYGDEVIFDFTFTFDSDGISCQTFFTEGKESDGYVAHNLVPRCKVQGTITVDGEKLDAEGPGFFVNGIQRHPQCIQMWNFMTLTHPDVSLMMMQFIMCEGYDADLVNRSMLLLDGKLVSISTDSVVEVEECEPDDANGYEAPVIRIYTYQGKMLDSDKVVSVILKTHVDDSETHEHYDLLSELPWLLRKALQMTISNPWMYQTFSKHISCTVEVEGEAPRTFSGARLFEEQTWLS